MAAFRAAAGDGVAFSISKHKAAFIAFGGFDKEPFGWMNAFGDMFQMRDDVFFRNVNLAGEVF